MKTSELRHGYLMALGRFVLLLLQVEFERFSVDVPNLVIFFKRVQIVLGLRLGALSRGRSKSFTLEDDTPTPFQTTLPPLQLC